MRLSTDTNIRASCQGKVAYSTFTQAQAVQKRVLERDSREDYVEPYRCRFCHHWHLGATERVLRK